MVHNASQRKKHDLFLLKATQNNVLTPLCIEQYIAVLIHQRKYIDTSTHCIVATLAHTHTHTINYCQMFTIHLSYSRLVSWLHLMPECQFLPQPTLHMDVITYASQLRPTSSYRLLCCLDLIFCGWLGTSVMQRMTSGTVIMYYSFV